MSFQRRNSVTNQAAYGRQWATPFSTEYHDGGQEQEVLITSLLQKKEASFQSQNGSTIAVRDIDRQRVTPLYPEFAKWRAITRSGELGS